MMRFRFSAGGCFHRVALVGRLVEKQETGGCMQKDGQNTKQYRNTEYTEQERNIKGILGRVIRK
jgi:hypothetical protein